MVQLLRHPGDAVTPPAGATLPAPPTRLASQRWLVAAGNFLFHWRNHVFPLVFFVVWILSRPRPAFGSPAADAALDVAGAVIAASGQLLRAAAIGYVYIVRGGQKRRIHAEDLVQDGLFAHARNPLYTGNFLVFLGLFVMIHSWLGYGIGVPFFAFAYLAIVAAEEAFLSRRFGDAYTEYCRRVPRFAPSPHGLRRTLGTLQFNWRRLVRKEYGATFTWMMLALAIVTRERIAWHGWQGARSALAWLLAGFIVLLAGYATARFLKKTQRL